MIYKYSTVTFVNIISTSVSIDDLLFMRWILKYTFFASGLISIKSLFLSCCQLHLKNTQQVIPQGEGVVIPLSWPLL